MAETSKGPAITSANLPKPVQPVNATVAATAAKTAVEAIDDNIVAAPLIEPDFLNLKPKNPNIAFRWILHTLFRADGERNILRFEQAKAQGYAVATKDDIVNPPTPYERDGGTKYVNGDLILMKIDRRRYQGAIAYREQQSIKAMLGVKQAGKKIVKSTLDGKGTRSQLAKIVSYDPESELQSMAGDSGDKQASEFVKGFIEREGE